MFDGHLVADVGGRFLLDTGSTGSFARTGEVTWGGRTRDLARSLSIIDADELSAFAGTPLDGLPGGDVLGERPFTLDLLQGVCVVHETISDRDGIALPLQLGSGVPITDLAFAGLSARACIDTGAKISYLERDGLADAVAVDEADDFFPGFGAFRTAIHEVPVQIAASTLVLRAGVLPERLAFLLAISGVGAILGTEIFAHFPTVTFDYGNRALVLHHAAPARAAHAPVVRRP